MLTQERVPSTMSSYGHRDYNSHRAGIKRERADDGMNDMDQKKVKTEQTASKVLHIRSLPSEAGEAEIKALGLPFGTVTNVLLLKAKHQAFLELGDIETAKLAINYYNVTPATVRGKTVIVQFSQHQELKTQERPNDRYDSRRDDSLDRGHNKVVIKVIVTNLVYPVTIDILQSVFSRCGELAKIVTFTRNDQFHALIQYHTPKEAAAAKTLFDGQNIYNGCNTLHIEFSKLDQLEVKFNNEKSRDFTKKQEPMIDPLMHAAQMQMAMSPGLLQNPPNIPPNMFNMFPSQMFNPAAMAAMPMAGMAPPFMQHSPGSMSPRGAGMGHHGGSVLLVSNLAEEDVCCDDLFILFGHYGDVQRIKILFNKKDTALIQFSDSSQAQTAQSNLNGVRLHGKEMRVSKSKHDNVNMPKSEDEGKELTKDYNGSPLHRFKKPGSKNFQNIFSPIRTLHLSNIPESTTEDDLRDLFLEYGSINNFRFFPKDRRMALMQLSSTEEAILCLIKLHNYKLNESSHLRVSFAKNEM